MERLGREELDALIRSAMMEHLEEAASARRRADESPPSSEGGSLSCSLPPVGGGYQGSLREGQRPRSGQRRLPDNMGTPSMQSLKREIRQHVEDLQSPIWAHALRNLRSLSARDGSDAQLLICNVGGLPPLLSLLRQAAYDAAVALGNLAGSGDSVEEAMEEEGCIPELVTALLLDTTGDGIKEQVARALRNLVLNSTSRSTALRQAGGVPPLVNLLKIGTDKARQHACLALVGVADGAALGKRDILEAGGVPLVVDLVAAGADDVKERAAELLLALAADSEPCAAERGRFGAGGPARQAPADSEPMRGAIHEAGGIPALVAVLSAGTDKAKEHAAGALANLTSRSELIRTAVYEAGGIPALVVLLGAAAHSSRKRALQALTNLTSHSELMGAAVHEAGGIPPLVALLGSASHFSGEGENALLALLASLTSCSESIRAAVHEAGGAPLLVDLLGQGTFSRTKTQAAGVLRNLTASSEPIRAAVHQAGGIRALVALLEPQRHAYYVPFDACVAPTGDNTVTVEAAAGALRNLAARTEPDGSEPMNAVHRAGGIPPLVALLQTALPQTYTALEHAAAALGMIATSPAAGLAIEDAGGVPALLALRLRGRGSAQTYASLALDNLGVKDTSAADPAEWSRPFLLQVRAEGAELTFRTMGGTRAATLAWSAERPLQELPSAARSAVRRAGCEAPFGHEWKLLLPSGKLLDTGPGAKALAEQLASE